jgi:phospholipase/carboxylesterase
MIKPRPLRKIGPLETLEIPGTPDGYGVVVLHGYGADARDLVSFSQLLSTPPGTTWLFPNGPLRINESGVDGRAWFPIDAQALQVAVLQNVHYDFSKATPAGVKQSREAVLAMLDAAKISLSKTVLIGFSQGAMLATDIALRGPERPLGLVVLSGTVINRDIWIEKGKMRAGLPFFQSHGEADPLLGFQYAQNLEKLFLEAGLKGQLHGFRGGHEVPQEIIHKLNQFLKGIFAPPRQRQ